MDTTKSFTCMIGRHRWEPATDDPTHGHTCTECGRHRPGARGARHGEGRGHCAGFGAESGWGYSNGDGFSGGFDGFGGGFDGGGCGGDGGGGC
ncbi:hypothetical protein [Terracoccus sp. 273MFTsu3.1]|uniref:hypothetical protein n=1 Tax=Terracoccus sp. 273MFTsu3.1 TaxID=1172188 RepID=UPI00037DBA02|nr:hypothetical protein [Terracoccus sp. 273MFTsu3.1]